MNGHEHTHRGEQGQGPRQAPGRAAEVTAVRTRAWRCPSGGDAHQVSLGPPGPEQIQDARDTYEDSCFREEPKLCAVFRFFFFVKFGESFSTRTKSASPLFTVLPAFWERVSVKPSAHTLPPPLPTHPAGPPRRAGGLRPGPQLGGGLVSRASAIWQVKCFILLTCQSRHYVEHLVCI